MPIDPDSYNHRGRGNWGIVLCCPNIVAPERLVYFDYNRQTCAWVIRDFITGMRLDDKDSTLSRTDIEADATHDEFPPWCSVEDRPADWTLYLRLRTTAHFETGGPRVSESAPNPSSGRWVAL
jgi:hypothetical protein